MKLSLLYPAVLKLSLLLLFIGCGSNKYFKAPRNFPNDRRHIKQPRPYEYNLFSDLLNKQITEQAGQTFDFSRQLRNLFGKPKQAMNVDAYGEVSNSSWFTNRNASNRMSIEEIALGPDTEEGPDVTGLWTIVRAKTEGVTPGFTIEDSRKVRYVIKFDPIGYSELATGAEVVSTKLFYAAGYNVPENYIVYFHPRILRLGDKVKFVDKKGEKRSMVDEDLDAILARIEYQPDGRIRALASKYIQGIPIGPFQYKGTRKDDPNDIIPHQHRRELRGLRVLSAWLNHTDTKDGNTFDSYFNEGGRSFVKHYLIDFGSTLGSAAHGSKSPVKGHENEVDPHEIFKNILTLGLYVRPWEKLEGVRYPSIGLYESSLFNPIKFKFNVPNPAFEALTNLDGYWGAKAVMSFTDAQLEVVVDEGMYSDPKAAQYLLQNLIERRDIVGRYWFERVAPLDRFDLLETSDGDQQLCFSDLAIEGGLEFKENTVYLYDLRNMDSVILESERLEQSTCIPLPGRESLSQNRSVVENPHSPADYWEIKIRVNRSRYEDWSKWVKVYLEYDRNSGNYSLLGIHRED
jgi:hypothetical protein